MEEVSYILPPTHARLGESLSLMVGINLFYTCTVSLQYTPSCLYPSRRHLQRQSPAQEPVQPFC